MSLHDQIEIDLRAAMKSRDKARTATLRMAVAALQTRAVAHGIGPQGRLDDDDVQQVLATEVKRRREAAAAYRDAGRADQAAGEESEAAVYETYLPAQLDDDELTEVVDEVVTATGADSPKQMGQVMKEVMARVQGRADGARVSGIVKQRLTS